MWRDHSQSSQSVRSNQKNIRTLTEFETTGVPSFEFKKWKSESVVSLDSYKGKVLILINFWATWCAPCIEEIPSLLSLVKKSQGKVVLFAISADESPEAIESFLKTFPLDKTENVYLGNEGFSELMQLYNVEMLPESYLVGLDGKLKKKIVGSINWDTEDSVAYINDLFEKNK